VNFHHRYDADMFNGAASGSRASRILGGAVVPLLLWGYGLYGMISLHIVVPVRYGKLTLTGADAVLFGAAMILAGGFIHVHYIWTVSPKLYRYAGLLKVVLLAGALAAYLWSLLG